MELDYSRRHNANRALSIAMPRRASIDEFAVRDRVAAMNLLTILQSENLGVCSGPTLPFGRVHQDGKTFPESELSLFYQEYTYPRENDDYGQRISYFFIKQLIQLCSEHATDENFDFIRRYIAPDAVISPVQKRDGRLIAVNLGIDVTDVPLRLRFNDVLYEAHGMRPVSPSRLYQVTRARGVEESLDPTRI